MPFEGYSLHCRERVESALTKAFQCNQMVHYALAEAMEYVIFNGGKRIRPLLTYAACQSVGGTMENADPAACSVELIHGYSLVHDDLPAMDDDDLRRGKPSCHKAYDEATAILVGDALQALAFDMLSDKQLFLEAILSDSQRLQQIRMLSSAAGGCGMVGGQMLDLKATGLSLTKDQLIKMHSHKTGDLIRACVRMGALSQSGVKEWQVDQLDQYASAIGLAFQVQDDILDVEADTQVLGKQQGADQALNKSTYVSIMGLHEAKRFALELCHIAISALADFDNRADRLRQLAEYIVNRSH